MTNVPFQNRFDQYQSHNDKKIMCYLRKVIDLIQHLYAVKITKE